MTKELKPTVINMKYLSQEIESPIVIGAAEANGRVLRIIFTQEARAQFSSSTKVYLSWVHQEKKIKGYNVFTEIIGANDENFPPTWEIYYPQSMLYEGNVIACIELVDDISIAASNNFVIHVLKDPNGDDYNYTYTDDYSEFKQAVIVLNSLADQMELKIEENQNIFDQIVEEFEDIKRTIITKNGTLVYPTVSNPIVINEQLITDGVYIKITMLDDTDFYINVTDLVEYNSVSNTPEVILTDNNHTISATIDKIAASKLIYREADNTDPENPISQQTVAQAIDILNSAIDINGTIDNRISNAISTALTWNDLFS